MVPDRGLDVLTKMGLLGQSQPTPDRFGHNQHKPQHSAQMHRNQKTQRADQVPMRCLRGLSELVFDLCTLQHLTAPQMDLQPTSLVLHKPIGMDGSRSTWVLVWVELQTTGREAGPDDGGVDDLPVIAAAHS